MPTFNRDPLHKQYGVDLWDSSDGWIGLPQFDPSMQFNDLDQAIAKCKEKQCSLTNAGSSHYGVIDLNVRLEVFCARGHNADIQ